MHKRINQLESFFSEQFLEDCDRTTMTMIELDDITTIDSYWIITKWKISKRREIVIRNFVTLLYYLNFIVNQLSIINFFIINYTLRMT